MSDNNARTLLGCDFTSAPTRRKPITLAVGRADRGRVLIDSVERFEALEAWSQRLAAPGCWVGGFDLPNRMNRRQRQGHTAQIEHAQVREAEIHRDQRNADRREKLQNGR